jgi:putative peptide zinc metalloprotease protein
MARRTFHEQWYRIAGLRVGLRPGTVVQRHSYRGEPWVVLHEPAHAGWFRARPDTYARIAALSPERTLGEIWEAQTRTDPATAPGQEDFFSLVRDLYKANLLTVEGGVSESRILERAIQKKRKPLPARVSELLFFRIPLWDPEPFLKRHQRAIRAIYSGPAVAVVLVTLVAAAITFALNAERALSQSSQILQLSNLIPLYLTIFATHILHEMSHAALTKLYGGHVRTMGVMLLLFTPLPYADLSSAWSFRDKWKRAAVGAAGMYADVFSCAVAVLVWAYSPPGLVNEIALNVMFVTAVYTLLFNSNPLMRFDGYYILSDLVEIPNLHQAAKKQLDASFKRYVLRDRIAPEDEVTPRRRSFLLGFFAVSTLYRLVIMAGIVIFIADRYFGLGLVVATALILTAFVMPVAKALKPLGNPHFRRKHRRPLACLFALGAVLVAALLFVPVPDARRLDGVVVPERSARLHVPATGRLVAAGPRSGDIVAAGEVIARLENPELDLQLRNLRARLRGAELRAVQSRARGSTDLAAIEEEIARMTASLATMEAERSDLVLHAPRSGIWADTALSGREGAWLSKGAPLGEIIPEDGYVFQAVLRQEAADGIGAFSPEAATLRLEGARAEVLPVADLSVVPFSRRDLPSEALGSAGGGDLAVSVAQQGGGQPGRQAVERFFLIKAGFAPEAAPAGLSGRSGWLRVTLEPRPLASQGWRAARQFFQRRYKL